MRAKSYLVLLIALCGWLSASPQLLAARRGSPEKLSIEELVAQLGDDQYLVRQQAETQLLQRGAAAFAALQAAERDADLEIATRARYILTQINIDWVRPGDTPVVRSIMSRYGELSFQSRLKKVGELAKLDQEEGFSALCRVARYESSGLVARYAALAILEKGFLPEPRTGAAIAKLNQEMGESEEVPVAWVRAYVDQLKSPKRLNPDWESLLDKEFGLLEQETGETNEAFTLGLLRNHLEFCDHFSDAPAILAALERRIELGETDDRVIAGRLIDGMKWIVDREQWEALGLLEQRYAGPISRERIVLYHLADARQKQGRTDDGEALARRALEFDMADPEERNAVADIIGELGHHDWAEREWQIIVDTVDATDEQALDARLSLAQLRLNDRLEHQAAADLLTQTIDAIDSDPALKQRYQTDRLLWRQLSNLRAHRELFLSYHHESVEEYEKQREHLEQAYKLDPYNNADILIAMFRMKEASEAYQKTAQQRIDKSLRRVETEMRKSEQSPHWYNHWAWLVSNTTGDFDRAVKYSQRSLELLPDSPSYLDTLGRCYYAAGDIENAIEVQRKAVAMHPHLLVMQRQLQLFEDELQKSANLEQSQ